MFVCPVAILHFPLVYGTVILLGQYVKEGGLLPQLLEPEIRLVKARRDMLFPLDGNCLTSGHVTNGI